MHVRRAIAFAGATAVALAARRAHAWPEAHQIGADAHLIVDTHGMASVEQDLRWHVVRGPLHWIDLASVDPAAVVDPNVEIAAADGRRLGAHAVRRSDNTLRLIIDEPQALVRGQVTFEVRWRIDLAAAQALTRDGAAWRLSWSAPPAIDGFDSARTTIELPAAPDEPRPIAPDTGAFDDSALATLRRGPERDVLELVRPHVSRGDSATWTIRVDARALPFVDTPRLHPPHIALGSVLAGLSVALGWLVFHKAQTFAAACAARGGQARSMLPLATRARALLAGASFAAAMGLQWAGEATAGAACVALAILAVACRAPRVRSGVRGPGQWTAVRPERAFARDGCAAGHWLDIGTTEGRLTALAGSALFVAAFVVAWRFEAAAAWVVALDAAVLVPLFITGRASQLPPDGARSVAPWLARAFGRLSALPGVCVTPWARVAPNGSVADELRLLVMPTVALPGLIGLEVGLAWSTTPVGWAATPEVLARVLEGSPAAATLARGLHRFRTVPGRRPDERVARLLPRAPTRPATIALVHALARALADRRVESRPGDWTAPDRRAAEPCNWQPETL
jgi:hypothetical protein